jgi:hypothetical protein
VLDQERQAKVGVGPRESTSSPANDAAIRAKPLAVEWIRDRRTHAAQLRHVGGEVARREGNSREAARSATQYRVDVAPEHPALGQRAVKHADQLQVRIAEPHQPVVRADRLVPSASTRSQPDLRL